LKALTHKKRDKPKDAYDIHDVIGGLPGGNEDLRRDASGWVPF
jgi:hypothetical protein